MSPIERVRAKAAASEVLGVRAHANSSEVRAAWRRAARQLHPDQDGGDSRNFVNARAAYEFLCDEQRPEPAAPCKGEQMDACADSSKNRVVTRPRLATRVEPISSGNMEACQSLLAEQTGRTDSDHVPASVARKGRELTFMVETPLAVGVNRVALPAGLLQGNASTKATVLKFSSRNAGAGNVELPAAVCAQHFVGARVVKIHFAVT